MSRRGRHSAIVIVVLLAIGLLPQGAGAQLVPDTGIPHPEPGFLHPDIPARPCTVENEYEAAVYDLEVGDVRYGEDCRRYRFAFGPIVVKPGENDALLEPVTIEKPAYNGYITRFKPDLVDYAGNHPRTEDMHLHHATWLNGGSSYGRGPFFASGEEKTIATFPEGYGMRVGGNDVWLLLYMVHNDETQPTVVWLTYDIDFVAEGDAAEHGIVPIRPLWLDVQNPGPEGSTDTSANPVFNVQRGFGHTDPETGRHVCTWPRENCARHDTYGLQTTNQGAPPPEGVDVKGTDWRVTSGMAGTIVGLGGHLHFGGIRTEVSLERDGVEKLINISDAFYWSPEDRDGLGKLGAPPWSWDFSMGVTGAPDWKVKIREGDVVRINAVTDSEDASWYEGMGIVVGYVATEDPHGPEGIDVFADDVIIDRGYPERMLIPEGPYDLANDWRPDSCQPDFTGEHNNGSKRLCLRGMPTHGPIDESSNHSGGCDNGDCAAFPDSGDGAVVDEIRSVGFTYGEADMGATGALGIPRIRKGEPARFWNYDTVARVWHTYTRCEYPCTGLKDMRYPAANGGGFPDDPESNVMDFDSNEIGYGTFFEPAAGQFPPSNTGKSWDQTVRDGLYWEFTPTEEGVYTFFCRIHKWMRGAVEVVDE